MRSSIASGPAAASVFPGRGAGCGRLDTLDPAGARAQSLLLLSLGASVQAACPSVAAAVAPPADSRAGRHELASLGWPPGRAWN